MMKDRMPAAAITILALLVVFTGCQQTEEIVEFDEMTAHMVESNLDLPAVLTDWITTAQVIFDAGVENYFIIDLRGSDLKPANDTTDYEDGHIPGAHLVALADVVDYEATNNTGDLPVVVVCYSGQTAGFAVTVLRLSGVPAKVLKFGMSSWNADFDVWMGNTDNIALGSNAWVDTDAIPALPTYGAPLVETGKDVGSDILTDQVAAMLTAGFKAKSGSDVLANHANYNVINYWAAADWELYGHVDGAYQVTPGELAITGDKLISVDPDRPNVVYCWTGQTASMIAAYLNVLGYEAYAMTYSANGLIYDNLQSHKWSEAAIGGYAYDTGP